MARIEPLSGIHKKFKTRTLRKELDYMFYIELLYSVLTLISAYTVVFQFYPVFGVILGAVMQLLWIHLWTVTGQLGIIFLDVGLLALYFGRIVDILKRRG
jgi:hypothetical protein